MKDLTLIIPAKNEAESLPKVLADLKKFNCKILVSLQKDDEDTMEEAAAQGFGDTGNKKTSGANAGYTQFISFWR